MKKLIVLSICLLLLACKSDEDKIPGWYTYAQKMKDFTLSGDITYYKNKQLKIVAKVETSIMPGLNINTTITFKGSWSYENGYLKEYCTSVETNPQFIGDALLKELKEKSKSDKGYKVLEVNKEQMRLQSSDGELLVYKRKKK
jgi:hypothetical protein